MIPPTLLFILETLSWGEIAGGLVGLGVLLWALKSGIPQSLFSTTNSLLEKRTTERDDALRERDTALKEVEQLEEEIKTMRREIIQRIDISVQDQETIRRLRDNQKDI
jgi:hypothetical protein